MIVYIWQIKYAMQPHGLIRDTRISFHHSICRTNTLVKSPIVAMCDTFNRISNLCDINFDTTKIIKDNIIINISVSLLTRSSVSLLLDYIVAKMSIKNKLQYEPSKTQFPRQEVLQTKTLWQDSPETTKFWRTPQDRTSSAFQPAQRAHFSIWHLCTNHQRTVRLKSMMGGTLLGKPIAQPKYSTTSL